MSEFDVARKNMVENQLRPSRIDDPRVLEAMGQVRRELFLPKKLRGVAYGDEDIDLGNNSFLIEPLGLAKILQAGAITPDDVVLVVGCPSGYSAAILAQMAATVFVLVGSDDAAAATESVLEEVGCDNSVVQVGSLEQGLEGQGPYGVIVIASRITAVPEDLKNQLDEGGRLVAIIEEGRAGFVQLLTRKGDAFSESSPFDARIGAISSNAPREEAFEF